MDCIILLLFVDILLGITIRCVSVSGLLFARLALNWTVILDEGIWPGEEGSLWE